MLRSYTMQSTASFSGRINESYAAASSRKPAVGARGRLRPCRLRKLTVSATSSSSDGGDVFRQAQRRAERAAAEAQQNAAEFARQQRLKEKLSEAQRQAARTCVAYEIGVCCCPRVPCVLSCSSVCSICCQELTTCLCCPGFEPRSKLWTTPSGARHGMLIGNLRSKARRSRRHRSERSCHARA